MDSWLADLVASVSPGPRLPVDLTAALEQNGLLDPELVDALVRDACTAHGADADRNDR